MPDILNRTNVYNEVHRERERAHIKHGAAGNSREDATWINAEWLPVLMEVLGEVAHELTYDARYDTVDDPNARRQALRKELIQVAAMACSWVDAIDRDAG
jgi:hypothetical protein